MKAWVVFLIYGVFLIGAGVTAFALANFQEKAKTALIMGGGSGAVMVGFSLLTAGVVLADFRSYTRIVGQVLVFVFAGVFGWRASLIWSVVEKEYLRNLLAVMSAASVVVFLVIFLTEPSGRTKKAIKKTN